MLKSLGQKIRLYRNIAGISQKKLAEKLDVSQHHLGCIERGESAPSMSLTIKICEILDMHPAVLFSAVSIKRPYLCSSELQNEPDILHMLPVPRHGMWMVDIQSGLEIWTKSLTRMMSLKPSKKACFNSFVKHIHDNDRKLFTDFYQALRSITIPEPVLLRTVTDHDSCRHLHVRADLHPGFENNSVMASMTFMDLTESKELYAVLRYNSEQVEAIVQERTGSLDLALKEKQQEIDLRDRAEKKAREKSNQLQMVLSSVPAVFYTFHPSIGRMEWHSLRMKNIIGISLQDLKNNPMLWHESIHPDDLPVVKQAIQKARKGKQLNVEYRLKGKDGQWRWLQDRATPLRDDRWDFYLAGVAINVSEQKQVQEALLILSKEYETIFNHSQNTFFLIDVDEQDRCTFQRLNSQEEALTGLTTETVRGKTPVQALGEELGLQVEKNYQRCIKEKRVVSYEETLHLPAGKRTWLTKLAPVMEGGKVVKIVGSGLDITDRKNAEDNLQKKEERLKLITSTSYDWEYWVKPDGSLEFCSPSCKRITGYSVDDFLRDPDLIQSIVHPEDAHFWNEHACMATSYQGKAELSFRIVARSGQVAWIEHKCVAVVGPDSAYLGRRVSNRDVTMRVNMEHEMRQENERLRRLLKDNGIAYG
ncbi:PAS domain-containing protein [Desulfonatronovibrio magnus]|uniref:PAS domain-containing protein n=1 Tax=Desulfonatronovibrio magnus TaxID=698827 RepID=UPI0012F88575|nr:PAS domain-containing protein [Desulfonatronovibrio magnus]